MKNYKLLVPVILVALFVVSSFMTYTSNGKFEKQYNDYLTAARSFADQGIAVDAIENYTKAMEIHVSFDLKMEIALFLKDKGKLDEAIDWGQEVLKSYPQKSEIYHYIMNLYSEAEDYIACFMLADTMQKRKLPMDSVSELLSKIENYYYLYGQYDAVSVFGGGYCAVSNKNVWGFVNETGTRVINMRFVEVGSFRQDLAPVLDSDSLAYFIDVEGNKKKTVIGVENIKRVGSIEDGVFTVFDGKKWGLYNSDYELVAGGFGDVSAFTNGIIAVNMDGKWSILDKEGKATSSNKYDEVVQDEKGIVHRNNRIFIKNNGVCYLIDKSGKIITNTQFEDARLFNDTTYAAVKVNGKWGFIDAEGKFIIEPLYANARSFSSGFAAVLIDGKWGFVNVENKLVIANIFDDAKDFNEHGCVFVNTGNEWELLKLYKFNYQEVKLS